MLKGRENKDKSREFRKEGRHHPRRHRRGTVLYVFDPTVVLAILLAFFYALSGGLFSFWSGLGGWSSDVYTGDYEGLAELDEEHLAVDEETGIEYVDNTILVLVEDGLTNAKKESIALSVDGVVIGEYAGMAGLLQIEVEVSDLAELEALAEKLEENELVYYACYDYVTEEDWEEETESELEEDVSDVSLSELLGLSSSIAGDLWGRWRRRMPGAG